MPEIRRRRFLDDTRKATLGLAGGVTILANPESVWATPANDHLVLAMIGVGGGRGHSLAMGFLDRGDCEIGYICDVDRRLHEPRANEYASRQGGKCPKCVQDFREILDGTVDIRPLDTFDIRPPRQLKARLALSQDRDSYKQGCQEVSFPQPPGRYDLQLIELARIIHGENANPYPLQHELLV